MASRIDIEEIRSHLRGGRLETACQLARRNADAGGDERLVALELRLLAARLLPADGKPSPEAERLLSEFENHHRTRLTNSHRTRLADLWLAAGRLPEATERYHRILQADPACFAVRHRLGLCELARAAQTRFQNPSRLKERWLRALQNLLLCVMNDGFWRDWSESRCRAYGVRVNAKHQEQARLDVVEKLADLLQQRMQAAESEGAAGALAVLNEVQNEFECDRVRMELLNEAVELFPPAEELPPSVPVPFGLLWYRREQAKPTGRSPWACRARAMLQELIRRGESSVISSVHREPDHTAPTQGVLWRQWYSRLAPVRYALRWGKFSAAEEALQNVCNRLDGCRPAEKSHLSRTMDSPRVCDPGCEMFTLCNPGYAETTGAGNLMDEDAHHLALDVALRRAVQSARSGPSGHLAAAEYWGRAKRLAETLNVEDEMEERVTAGVNGLVDRLSGKPDEIIGLLGQLLRVLPSPTLKGRLSDTLLNHGVGRLNKKEWADAATFSRKALQLNPSASRAAETLLLALQALANLELQRDNLDEAREHLLEMTELLELAERYEMETDNFPVTADWVENLLQTLDELHGE